MFVGVVGLNHDTAPLELRENLSFGTNEILPALEELTDLGGVDEGVLLSTCNRTELYFRGDQQGVEETILNWFSARGGRDVEDLKEHSYCYRNLEGAEHLFRVITGLDSMVLGEVEVAGQVKEAYELSKEGGVTGKYLNYLFQKSFEVNKDVRRELNLDGLALSLSHVAVDKLEELLGGLKGSRGMVIGVGEVGELALEYLIEHGIDGVWVANRTKERSEEVTD
ncbi:glutamyl-tRNA reductase, partial [Candidatus Bipolaricaulota bacterium]|nr:glutamyl-tRNA reductase [Candidatus Bipolaricaulota bacterium]